MGLDTIAKNIIRFYRESLDDVESLKVKQIDSGPLRRMVEGHYFEMSWELHYFLWNHTLPGAIRTTDATIAADNEGGIHIRRHTTEGWSV